ncbi:hypothetical protein SKAU_G00355930 [Synaphobranchus kaupii]|uniref:Uncharacterized protein n=1 Tax=Synaphobranchus kaupii TaxID=118154 RepID=A0A9Q1IGF2_SYNKA|nr:hypothetical protein SKAU_G00355930 [Synaphobranchus kaupii]
MQPSSRIGMTGKGHSRVFRRIRDDGNRGTEERDCGRARLVREGAGDAGPPGTVPQKRGEQEALNTAVAQGDGADRRRPELKAKAQAIDALPAHGRAGLCQQGCDTLPGRSRPIGRRRSGAKTK